MIFNIIQIILSVLLIACVLLQTQGGGISRFLVEEEKCTGANEISKIPFLCDSYPGFFAGCCFGFTSSPSLRVYAGYQQTSLSLAYQSLYQKMGANFSSLIPRRSHRLFLSYFFSSYLVHLFPQKERVGMVGAYSLDKLPDRITQKLSRGLTKLSPSGEIKPDLAESWQIRDSGKTYVFKIKRGIRFSNGTEVTSKDPGVCFKDVKIERPDKYTIIFHLHDEYAPFLVTISRPIFPRGLQGLGEYTITDIKINGDFISSLTLSHTADKHQVVYVFYPNQEALKTAFLLGEATEIDDIINTKANNTDIATHKNVAVSRQTNYDQLVTLFYNTKDQVISDNKLRKALSYSLPDSFSQGERAHLPYPPRSIYFSKEAAVRSQDLAHAKLLLDAVYLNASESARPELIITTLTKYHVVAASIAKIWEGLGVKVKLRM